MAEIMFRHLCCIRLMKQCFTNKKSYWSHPNPHQRSSDSRGILFIVGKLAVFITSKDCCHLGWGFGNILFPHPPQKTHKIVHTLDKCFDINITNITDYFETSYRIQEEKPFRNISPEKGGRGGHNKTYIL